MGRASLYAAAICGSKRPTADLMRDPPQHREATHVAAYPKFKLERSHSYRIASKGSAFIACRAGTTIAVVSSAAVRTIRHRTAPLTGGLLSFGFRWFSRYSSGPLTGIGGFSGGGLALIAVLKLF
jgi:hypothetical protein